MVRSSRSMSRREYDAHHQHPVNRAAHRVGIPLIVAAGAALLWPGARPPVSRRAAAIGFASGWGLLWAGHAIEGNRPVLLSNPAAAVAALKWWMSGARGGDRAAARGATRGSGIPRDPAFDSTWALFREGYTFMSSRCARLGSDAFATRLMLRPVVCTMGAEAARMFYEPGRFTRRGAMPVTTLMLLQDWGSVQQLDDEAHRHRKRMFLSFTTDPVQIQRLVDAADLEWSARLGQWERRPHVVLHEEARHVLARAACRWAGVPLPDSIADQRAKELGAMIDAAATAAAQKPAALLLRSRTERWARQVISSIRRGEIPIDESAPASVIASHRDAEGRLLDLPSAGVELLNVLRPIVAVGRYITFAGLALHDHPECRRRAREEGAGYRERFAQEVRRFYPFFAAIGGRVRQPFEWKGHQFRQGDWMLLDLYGTNHDPRIWDAPDAFRPDRFETFQDTGFGLIPQGGGDPARTHRCPGDSISVALTASAVRLLVEHVDYEMPPQDLTVDLRKMPAIPASRVVMANVRRAA